MIHPDISPLQELLPPAAQKLGVLLDDPLNETPEFALDPANLEIPHLDLPAALIAVGRVSLKESPHLPLTFVEVIDTTTQFSNWLMCFRHVTGDRPIFPRQAPATSEPTLDRYAALTVRQPIEGPDKPWSHCRVLPFSKN